MDQSLELFEPASEGFAMIVESLEAAGVSLEADSRDGIDED